MKIASLRAQIAAVREAADGWDGATPVRPLGQVSEDRTDPAIDVTLVEASEVSKRAVDSALVHAGLI